MRRFHRTLAIVFALSLAAALPVAAADEAMSDEAAIHALVKTWSAAAEAKDVDAFMKVYAPDAVVMLEGLPDMVGHEAIHAGLGEMMEDPHFHLSFTADDVVVAKSGDLAYETGTFKMGMSGPDGEAVSQAGHYVVVWRKDAEGNWKVVIDAPISD